MSVKTCSYPIERRAGRAILIALAIAGATGGLARAQVPVPDQPLSNLQNGISPDVALVRHQEDDRFTAARQLEKSQNDKAIAIRSRLAEHDCTGAQNLAAQSQIATLSAEVETLCAPNPLASPTGGPGAPQP